MLRYLASLALVLGLTTLASATPTLTFTSASVGGGLTAYDFTFHANDALNSSGFVSITFSTASGINQTNSILGAVDSSATATSLNGVSGYLQLPDSWFYTPWALNGINAANFNNGAVSGVGTTATTYGLNAGSGTGSQITDSLFAHIVTTGTVTWTGTLSRNGQDTPVAGTTAAVPEPASLAVLGLGTLALLARARRRA